ncbi:MAG: PAS domain S-box protein, partial [Ilumatobacteraceae bacterium]
MTVEPSASADVPTDVMDDAYAIAIVAASPTAIVVFDVDGKILDWNPAAAQMLGYTRAETVGRPVGELIVSENLRVDLRDSVVAYIVAGDTDAFDRPHTLAAKRADGARIWVELTLRPLTPWGQHPLFVAWLREIAEYDEAAEVNAESRRQALLTNISDIITVMGPNGEWISTSGAGSRMLGWASDID